MTSVVLDANALMMPFQFNINLDFEMSRLFGDPDVYIPSSVMYELKGLKRKDALMLAEKYDIYEVDSKRDEGVLQAAAELKAVLVTNDGELRKRAREQDIPVAYLRKKAYLEVDGEY
ncbi:MAG: twitching motility protein PilT [Thermoplasmata archaeon]